MSKINNELNKINDYINELENKVEENNNEKNKIKSIINEIFSNNFTPSPHDLCEILVILKIDDIQDYKYLQTRIKDNI